VFTLSSGPVFLIAADKIIKRQFMQPFRPGAKVSRKDFDRTSRLTPGSRALQTSHAASANVRDKRVVRQLRFGGNGCSHIGSELSTDYADFTVEKVAKKSRPACT